MEPTITLISSGKAGDPIELLCCHPNEKYVYIGHEITKRSSTGYCYEIFFAPGAGDRCIQHRATHVVSSSSQPLRHAEEVQTIFVSVYLRDGDKDNIDLSINPPTEPVNTQRPGGGSGESQA